MSDHVARARYADRFAAADAAEEKAKALGIKGTDDTARDRVTVTTALSTSPRTAGVDVIEIAFATDKEGTHGGVVATITREAALQLAHALLDALATDTAKEAR